MTALPAGQSAHHPRSLVPGPGHSTAKPRRYSASDAKEEVGERVRQYLQHAASGSQEEKGELSLPLSPRHQPSPQRTTSTRTQRGSQPAWYPPAGFLGSQEQVLSIVPVDSAPSASAFASPIRVATRVALPSRVPAGLLTPPQSPPTFFSHPLNRSPPTLRLSPPPDHPPRRDEQPASPPLPSPRSAPPSPSNHRRRVSKVPALGPQIFQVPSHHDRETSGHWDAPDSPSAHTDEGGLSESAPANGRSTRRHSLPALKTPPTHEEAITIQLLRNDTPKPPVPPRTSSAHTAALRQQRRWTSMPPVPPLPRSTLLPPTNTASLPQFTILPSHSEPRSPKTPITIFDSPFLRDHRPKQGDWDAFGIPDPLGEGGKGGSRWPASAHPGRSQSGSDSTAATATPTPRPLAPSHSKLPDTPSGPAAQSRAPVVSVLVRPGTLDVGTRFGLLSDSQVNFTGRPGIFFPKNIALDPKDGFRFAIEARSWGGLLKVVGAFGASIVSEKEKVHSGFQSITDASLTLEFLPDSTGIPILRLNVSLPHNLLATPLDLSHDFPPSSSLKFPHQRFSLPFHPVLPFALGSVAATLTGLRMSADVAGSSRPGPTPSHSYESLRELNREIRRLEASSEVVKGDVVGVEERKGSSGKLRRRSRA